MASNRSNAGKFITPLREVRLADAVLVNMLGGLEAGRGGGGGDLGGSGLCEFIVGDGGRLGSILVKFVNRLVVFSMDLLRGFVSCSCLSLLEALWDWEVTGLNMNLSFEERSWLETVCCPGVVRTSELGSVRLREREDVGRPVEGNGSVV